MGELEHNVNDKNLLVEVDTTDILNYYNHIVTGDILSSVLRRVLFRSSVANIINLVLNPIKYLYIIRFDITFLLRKAQRRINI